DWSSDVCSSDLAARAAPARAGSGTCGAHARSSLPHLAASLAPHPGPHLRLLLPEPAPVAPPTCTCRCAGGGRRAGHRALGRQFPLLDDTARAGEVAARQAEPPASAPP